MNRSKSQMVGGAHPTNLGMEEPSSGTTEGEESPEAPGEGDTPRKGTSHLKVVN